jgi:hypothetical protein
MQRRSSAGALGQQKHAADNNDGSGDRRIRNVVFLIPRGVDRPDIQDLFAGGESEAAPDHDDNSDDNQNACEYFHECATPREIPESSSAPLMPVSGFHRQFGWANAALEPDLFHKTLMRVFIGPPAQKLRAMAKARAREVIVLHFDHEVRPQRLPFA